MRVDERRPWVRWPVPAGHDRHGLGILDDQTCRELLATHSVGRVALTADALPAVFPVNYVFHDDAVLFASEQGAKLAAAQRGDIACFEIDHMDAINHCGWSVMATGRLQTLSAFEVGTLADLRLMPWALVGDTRVIRLRAELLTGRVFGHC